MLALLMPQSLRYSNCSIICSYVIPSVDNYISLNSAFIYMAEVIDVSSLTLLNIVVQETPARGADGLCSLCYERVSVINMRGAVLCHSLYRPLYLIFRI